MKRVAWLTDLHLNFLTPEEMHPFLDVVAEHKPDAVLISGDIAEARSLAHYLQVLARVWPSPIYFVLGNHDFYFGSIREVREQTLSICRQHSQLHYLTGTGVYELSPSVAVVGHDGWADARCGDYERSLVMMNDYRLIAELAATDKQGRWPLLRGLGDEAAAVARAAVESAADGYAELFFVTHVPPFPGACWHEGRLSDDQWLPHFCCHAMGQMLMEVLTSRPHCQATVLCGHTHGCGEYQPLPNLRVLTGGAVYGLPQIQRIFEVDV